MSDLAARIAGVRRHMQSLLPEQLQRVDWPRDRLDEYRQDRIRDVLAHAIEGSAWQRERLAGVEPATFRLDQIRSIPTMTKHDLIANFDALSTDPRVTRARCDEHLEGQDALLDGEFTVTASGGTTGVRAISAARIEWMGETFAAGLLRFVTRWRMRTGSAGPPSTPFMLASAPGHHGSSLLKRIFGSDRGRAVSVVEPIADIVAALNEEAPSHLIVYSSFIPRLAEEQRAGRLQIGPSIITPVAESFLPEHESAVADAWPDAVVISSWGATETGLLGAGSGFDPGMLLLDDMVIVEPVDAGGEPVAPGTMADKLFVTPLVKRILPIVRYELTDQLTVIDEPSSCGSAFTRISYVRGRHDDEFVYAGGIHVHAHTFRTVLSRRREITEYQIEQTARGATVRLVPASETSDVDTRDIESQLTGRLAHLGIRDPLVTASVVESIPRTPHSTKLRRFLPLRDHSAGRVVPT